MNSEQLYEALDTAIKAVGEVPCQSAPDFYFEREEDAAVINGWARTKAIQLCDTCPVKRLCLQYAMAAGEVYGVWGGTNAAQRRELRSRARRGVPGHLPKRGRPAVSQSA